MIKKTPVTDAQAKFLLDLAKERKPLNGVVINDRDDLKGVSKAEASALIKQMLRQPPKEGSKTAKTREIIANVPAGTYTFTPTQAAKVKNYNNEPYFGKVPVTVTVSRNESGAFWINRIGEQSHPVEDKRAKVQIMLACAAKSK